MFGKCCHSENLKVNSFLASGNFSRLLRTFTNSLNPDQGRLNVDPDLDQKILKHSDSVLNIFF